MQQRSVKVLKQNDVLAGNVYSSGRVLFRRGHRLRSSDLNALRNSGVRTVYIQDEDDAPPSSSGLLSDGTRDYVADNLRDVFRSFESFSPQHLERIRGVADIIVDEIQTSGELRIRAHELRSYDDYTYRHSVNVTAIAVAVAKLLFYDDRELRRIAVGGLMHDIGKMRLPKEILHKRGALDEQELLQVRKHPQWGFEILADRASSAPQEWAVAYQHHETNDGTGYPDGRTTEQIHPWARIVAVADLWDALRSNRPYKKGWPADKVLEFMTSDVIREKLDAEAIDSLAGLVIPYPNGSVVELSNGIIAEVVEQNDENPSRPVVRVMRDEEGRMSPEGEGRWIKLQSEVFLKVTKTLM